MEKKELLECISFFKGIKVTEQDVTTEAERDNHQKVVIVTYQYQGHTFVTDRLYYMNILHQGSVKNPQAIINYFGTEVFWLDIERHPWPKGRGEAELEETIIEDMASDGQDDFKDFLYRLANNDKTGYIQRITAEGKSQQYHHNFENNNHWHDLIWLIQAIIKSGGNEVGKKYFSRLVFKWDGNKNTDRERSSLAKLEGGNRKFINDLYNNVKSVQAMLKSTNLIEVIKHKGQIILQGPPGTGKTYTAKDLAEQLILNKVSVDKKLQKDSLEASGQFKIIQFHPAYSYEDFVRGIVAENKGTAIEYKTKDKLLAEFAKKALENYNNSRKDLQQLTEENWIEGEFEKFRDYISDEIEKNDGKLLLEGTTTYLREVEADCFRYTGDKWNNPQGLRMYYKDIIEMYRQGLRERQQIKRMEGVSGLAKQHASYYMKVLNLFNNFMEGKKKPIQEIKKVEEKPYVLIIDEINRANLPAVLGELIYALEYRGEKVESMYETVEDGYTLIIPPNLYIIGTMNTADRSVGHIDYAIRRRFAFVDMLPKALEMENFELDFFRQVSRLFIQNVDEYLDNGALLLALSEHLSEEFRPEDVWLGHSYFIKGNGDFETRKQYEIIPILKEYVKDGILKHSALDIINGF